MKRTKELTKRSNKLIIINQSLYGIFRKITLFQKSAQVSLVNQFSLMNITGSGWLWKAITESHIECFNTNNEHTNPSRDFQSSCRGTRKKISFFQQRLMRRSRDRVNHPFLLEQSSASRSCPLFSSFRLRLQQRIKLLNLAGNYRGRLQYRRLENFSAEVITNFASHLSLATMRLNDFSSNITATRKRNATVFRSNKNTFDEAVKSKGT